MREGRGSEGRTEGECVGGRSGHRDRRGEKERNEKNGACEVEGDICTNACRENESGNFENSCNVV